MSTNYHTAITTGASNAPSTVNGPLGTLDAQITNNVSRLTSLETSTMTSAYAQANGAASTANVTVDNVSGTFIDGATVVYVVSGALHKSEVSTNLSADGTLVLTAAPSVTIPDNTPIFQVPSGALQAVLDTDRLYHPVAAGAAGDGSTDDRAALNTLVNTTLASGGAVLIDRTYRIASNLTIPANVELRFTRNGKISVDSGATLTINGYFGADRHQIFSGAGSVSLAFTWTVFPEWFGAVADGNTTTPTNTDNAAAIQKAIDSMDRGSLSLRGRYEVSAGINIESKRISVVGETGYWDSIIICRSGWTGTAVLNFDDPLGARNGVCKVEGVAFYGKGEADIAIRFDESSQVKVSDCYFEDFLCMFYLIDMFHSIFKDVVAYKVGGTAASSPTRAITCTTASTSCSYVTFENIKIDNDDIARNIIYVADGGASGDNHYQIRFKDCGFECGTIPPATGAGPDAITLGNCIGVSFENLLVHCREAASPARSFIRIASTAVNTRINGASLWRLTGDASGAGIQNFINIADNTTGGIEIRSVDLFQTGTEDDIEIGSGCSNIIIDGIKNRNGDAITITNSPLCNMVNVYGTPHNNRNHQTEQMTLAVDAIENLPSVQALIAVDTTERYAALFMLKAGGNGTEEMLDSSNVFSVTKDTASSVNIYYDAGYKIQNKRAVQLTINIAYLT